MKQAKVIILVLIAVILLAGVVVGKNLLVPKTGKQGGGWQTYTDRLENYSFQYPSDWFLETGNPNQLANYDMEKAPPGQFDPERDKDKIKIEIYSTDQLYDSIEKYLEEQEGGERMGQGPAPTYESAVVGGQEAKRAVEERLGALSIYVKNPATGHIHSITAMPNYNLHKTIIEQILATFKFYQESEGLPATKETNFSEAGVYLESGQKFAYPYTWGQKGPLPNNVKLVFTDESLCQLDREEKPCSQVKFVNEMVLTISGEKLNGEVRVLKVKGIAE